MTCNIGDQCADNCHINADCTNTSGSFECTCHTGFIGDGVSCTDIDECAENKDNCLELVDTDCTNTLGSFECKCKTGFTAMSDLY